MAVDIGTYGHAIPYQGRHAQSEAPLTGEHLESCLHRAVSPRAAGQVAPRAAQNTHQDAGGTETEQHDGRKVRSESKESWATRMTDGPGGYLLSREVATILHGGVEACYHTTPSYTNGDAL